MENRALGKGLSALIPDKVSKAGGEVTFLKTELIQDNPFQIGRASCRERV